MNNIAVRILGLIGGFSILATCVFLALKAVEMRSDGLAFLSLLFLILGGCIIERALKIEN
jgi:hypothetical protein